MKVTEAERPHSHEEAELARFGIERVPTAVYLWGGYRYSSARDAIAAARRVAKP